MDAVRTTPPPEADLIRLAREARGLSPEQAADMTPLRLGGRRWRQIEKGYERLTPFKAVKANPVTLAHMARAVGVSPERLQEAGRSDAADILREIQRQHAEQAPDPAGLQRQEERLRAAMDAVREVWARGKTPPGRILDAVERESAELNRLIREAQGSAHDPPRRGRAG